MNNESVEFEELQLKTLQDILHNRIKQKKEEIHNPHSEAYKGSLSREIETSIGVNNVLVSEDD